jgi:hypothetical protein
MKRILSLAACAWLITTLGACAVYTPSGSVVVVDPGVAHVPVRGGGFCPPGQAKKGNC